MRKEVSGLDWVGGAARGLQLAAPAFPGRGSGVRSIPEVRLRRPGSGPCGCAQAELAAPAPLSLSAAPGTYSLRGAPRRLPIGRSPEPRG